MSDLVLIPLAPKFPGYFAGNDGNVYSTNHRWRPFIAMKPIVSGTSPYLHLVLINLEGKPCTQRVHTLVCQAFHGEKINPSLEASHLNGNRLDNRSSNLLWETKVENGKRKIEHGTDDCGVRNSRALFELAQLNQIREWLASGVRNVEIARRMKCHARVISLIKIGKRYKR